MKIAQNINYSPLIISIESRKGGVGKTTAALCLAKMLLNKKFKVLFLDLDISGTNVSDLVRIPLWRQSLNVLKIQGANGDENDRSKQLNILELFVDSYMNGKRLPEFTLSSENVEAVAVDLSKINVIGSQIYKLHGDAGKNAVLIERPAVLFDDLYTAWFIDMTDSIINMFKTQCGKNDNIAIIIDNSPGYVGWGPAIQNWMTDMGPEYNKFVYVMSLDVQDLLACERAIASLHKLFCAKWSVSRKYRQAISSKQELSIEKEEEDFFVRLTVEGSANKNKSNIYKYYLGDDSGTASNGNKYYKNKDQYIAALINKVPRDILENNHRFEQFNKSAEEILYGIYGEKLSFKGRRDSMVSYNERLTTHFMPPLRMQSIKRTPRTREIEREFLESIDKTLAKIASPIEEPRPQPKNAVASITQLIYIFNSMHSAVIDTAIELNRWAKEFLYPPLHPDWQPRSIITKYRAILKGLLDAADVTDVPLATMPPMALNIRRNISSTRRSDIEYLHSQVQRLIENDYNYTKPRRIEIIANSVVALTVLSLDARLSATSISHRLIELLAWLISAIDHRVILNYRDDEIAANDNTVRMKMIISDVTRIKKYEELMNHPVARTLVSKIGEKQCLSIVLNAADNIIRLQSVQYDTIFLFRVVRWIVEHDGIKTMQDSNIRSIIDRVIVTRDHEHDTALLEIENYFNTINHLIELEYTLNTVLAKWGI